MIEFITGLFFETKNHNDLSDDFQDINDDLDLYANKIQKWYRKILYVRRGRIGNIYKNKRLNILKNRKVRKKRRKTKA